MKSLFFKLNPIRWSIFSDGKFLAFLALAGFFYFGGVFGAGLARAAGESDHLWHFNECAGEIAAPFRGSESLSLGGSAWKAGRWNCSSELFWSGAPMSADFNEPLTAGELAISAWVNFPYDNSRFFFRFTNPSGEAAKISIDSVYVDAENLTGPFSRFPSPFPADGAWHQAVFTINASGGLWKLYFDGNEVLSSSLEDYEFSRFSRLEIGTNNNYTLMDEIAVWRRALDSEEVRGIYGANAEMPPAAPVIPADEKETRHLWQFDEGSGDILNDAAGETDLTQNADFSEGKWGGGLSQSWQPAQRIDKSLDKAITSRDLTFEFWFKNASHPNEGRGSIYLSGPTGNFGIQASPSALSLFIPGETKALGSLPALSDDGWHYLALVFNSHDYRYDFYIDGQNIYSKESIPLINPSFDTIHIRGENFPYSIDELAIFQGALSQDEIREYYNSGKPRAGSVLEPVIIVPGIMGSVLKEDNILIDNEIWPDPLTYLTDPIDEQLKKLEMDSFGFSKENIFPADAIRSVFGINFYGGLIEYLEASGYEEGKNLFIFPYDWRLDLNIIAGEDEDVPEVVTLKEKIDEVISQSGSDKLNIIAHSMGGLIVKAYAQKYGQERINKFIDIATPHLGAPKVAKILNYGDDLDIGIFINDIGIGILNESKIKDISQNMPSIYQLLPSAPYFSLPGEEYGHYLFNDSNSGINLPKGELDYNESMQYLIGTGEDGRNYFVNKNSLLHSAIDNVEIDNSYNIAGCGKATIGKIGDLGKKKFFWDKYKIEYIDGDGTVPLRSADYYGGDKKYYSRGQEHSKILSADGVKEFIGSILSGNEAGFDFSQYGNFKQDDSICGISGKVVEYHCPVEMHIYDNQGNHAGPLENGDIEMNIPGVQYDIVGDNKFVYLPEGGSYAITGTATTTGVLEVEVSEVKNNKYINTAYFSDINFDSASTKIEFSLADNLDDQLIEVDKDGDGIYEDSFAPDSLLTEEERKDLTKPNTNISLTGTEGKNGYYVSEVGIELTAEDENSGVLKTEYSLDNGQSWIEYQGRFLLVEDGEYKIIYSSTDRAGNREAEKEALIRVDKLAPEILILIPEEISHNEKLNIEYLIDDNISGAATNTIAIYLDDKLVTVAAIDLFYEKLGQHEIKIIAEDLAGNKAEEIRSISIITNIEGTISDVTRANGEKMVNEKARRELVKDLEKIEDYIKKYGRREEKRDKRQKELMDKCVKKKGKSWCESRLGKAFVKVNYGLNKIHDKIVEARYKLILKELELYRKKNWVTETGYGIIREDLRYLIAKL
ncbi:MAG: alpha/beta fold hydrolase [Patescibacteria group bacterium]|jgi:hypothetical protein